MNNEVALMIESYHPSNIQEKTNVVKEVLQEVALSGLAKAGFFDHAAFYGGTSLRIFYGLNRFSEDLDFALINQNEDFHIENFFPFLVEHFKSYGININVESKNKAIFSDVQSSFIKVNAQELMASLFPNVDDSKRIVFNQKFKIKFEIDIHNPSGGKSVIISKSDPISYQARVFDLPTLFAGKISALLFRKYLNNVKGRDYYDYLFFINKDIPVNLKYLENKMKNSGNLLENDHLTLEMVKQMLFKRFSTTDFELAKNDIINFIDYNENINQWDASLFIKTLDHLHD